ncbi:MAG: hypothetical protein JWN05_2553 [Arthrobacter sp.]|nr:hypothetical protein [Arthrobacter sp.]
MWCASRCSYFPAGFRGGEEHGVLFKFDNGVTSVYFGVKALSCIGQMRSLKLVFTRAGASGSGCLFPGLGLQQRTRLGQVAGHDGLVEFLRRARSCCSDRGTS